MTTYAFAHTSLPPYLHDMGTGQKETDKDAMRLVALRIERLLKTQGLTMEDLASKARVGYSALYSYVAGNLKAHSRSGRVPAAFTAGRIAAALGVSFDDLFMKPPTTTERSEMAAKQEASPRPKKTPRKRQ